MVVPTSTVNLLTERAVSAALSMGDTAVAVAGDEEECEQVRRDWNEWKPGVPIEVLLDPHRSLTRTVLRYIESIQAEEATITVLIPEIIPSKRRHEILHNQRGRLLEASLTERADVVVAVLPFHIDDYRDPAQDPLWRLAVEVLRTVPVAQVAVTVGCQRAQ